MIASAVEYAKAQDELAHLEKWLARLQSETPLPAKGMTKAGIRKMIARIHEELAVNEGRCELDGNELRPF